MIRRIGRLVRDSVRDIAGGLIAGLPGPTGRRLRRVWWGRRLAYLGPRVAIDEGVRIEGAEWISIGADTWIDRGVILLAGPPRPGRETRRLDNGNFAGRPGEMRLGARCHVGPYTILSAMGGLELGDEVTVSAGGRLYSLSHHYRSHARPHDRTIAFGSQTPDDRQALVAGPIVLGENVGLGADCLVLPGVSIGACSFVAPRSVVRRDLPANTLAGGDPAEIRGPRFAEDDREERSR